MLKRTGLFLVFLLLAVFWGCQTDDGGNPAGPILEPKAEDATGNNLSFPVIWADDFAKVLRGTYGVSMFDGMFTNIDGIDYYHQQDPLNEWQAESVNSTGGPVVIDWIDWGDNLESRPWPDRAKVRVEVVLFKDLVEPMTGYEMGWISGLGADEMWGTSTFTYDSYQATVYSHNARLTIQKLTADPAVADLTWNPTIGEWMGDVAPETFYNEGVWMVNIPGEGYSAEINVKGKVIYGMLWDVKENGDGPGTYRLTFSLGADNAPNTPLNTFFDETTQIVVGIEEEEKEEPSGGVVTIDIANNLTYMDLPIVRGNGGGGSNPHDDGSNGDGNGNGNGQGGPPH